MKKLHLIILLFLAIAMGATAQQRNRDIPQAACYGDPEAQFTVGYTILYEPYKFQNQFSDVRKEEDRKLSNEEYAVKCLKSAANQDQADAKLYLGFCYKNGLVVEKNQQEALKLINEATEKADNLRPRSQYDLAKDYYYANKNYAEAAKLFKAAAKRGDWDAMGKLGVCYLKGEGVEQNYTEAVKLLKYAEDKFVREAESYLGMCYIEGLGVEKDKDKAVKLLERAAYGDEPMALCLMGMTYKTGSWGKVKDLKEAARLFEKAAKKDFAEGQFQLGQCYYKGEGVECSISKAKELYIKAAKQGHEEAQAELKKRFNMDVTAE